MKRHRPAPTWIVDYSAARAHAIRWLGDRYLLARFINGSQYRPLPSAAETMMAGTASESDRLQLASRWPLPVMFWVHGGNTPVQLTPFARTLIPKGVVFVSANFREGALG